MSSELTRRIHIRRILTYALPFADVQIKSQSELAQIVMAGRRPNLLLGDKTGAKCEAPAGFVALLCRCWNSKDSNRPRFDQICEELSLLSTKEMTTIQSPDSERHVTPRTLDG